MFETLRGLSHTRDHLKHLRSIYTASDGVHQVWNIQTPTYNSVSSVSRFVLDIFRYSCHSLQSTTTRPLSLRQTVELTLFITHSCFSSGCLGVFFHSCGNNIHKRIAKDFWPWLLMSISSLHHTARDSYIFCRLKCPLYIFCDAFQVQIIFSDKLVIWYFKVIWITWDKIYACKYIYIFLCPLVFTS